MQHNGLPTTLDITSYMRNPTSGGSYDVECSSPDPTKYHDPATQDFKTTGQSLLQATGRFGIRGTVIPRATFGGASMGVDHEHASVVVIDPGEDGTGLEVDMSKNTPELSLRTCQAVKTAVNNISGLSDTKRTRLRTASYFHALGKEFADNDAPRTPVTIPVQVRQVPAEAPPPQVEVIQAPPQVNKAVKSPSGLNMFANPQPPAVAPRSLSSIAADSGPSGDVTVSFGIGDEDVPATFSTMIRVPGSTDPTKGALVLGVKQGQRGFFPKGEGRIAAWPAGSPTVLLIEATRIAFSHAGEDLAVYLVVGEKPV